MLWDTFILSIARLRSAPNRSFVDRAVDDASVQPYLDPLTSHAGWYASQRPHHPTATVTPPYCSPRRACARGDLLTLACPCTMLRMRREIRSHSKRRSYLSIMPGHDVSDDDFDVSPLQSPATVAARQREATEQVARMFVERRRSKRIRSCPDTSARAEQVGETDGTLHPPTHHTDQEREHSEFGSLTDNTRARVDATGGLRVNAGPEVNTPSPTNVCRAKHLSNACKKSRSNKIPPLELNPRP